MNIIQNSSGKNNLEYVVKRQIYRKISKYRVTYWLLNVIHGTITLIEEHFSFKRNVSNNITQNLFLFNILFPVSKFPNSCTESPYRASDLFEKKERKKGENLFFSY